MLVTFPTDKRPITLLVTVTTRSPEEICLFAKSDTKPSTFYTKRKGVVNGERVFEIRMPKSPANLSIGIYNSRNGLYKNNEDKSFSVKITPKTLKTCPIWLSHDTAEFVKFAQWFSENASMLSANIMRNGKVEPSIYGSEKRKFIIIYFNKIKEKIRDKKTGEVLGYGGSVDTPARIGNSTGRIEVSKEDFLKFSVPMRMIILLHEFSHKYMNPLINRPVTDEISADINAAMIYLSLGYSPVEAQQAYLTVLRKANNKGNFKRFLILRDFIRKFEKGDIACNVSDTSKKAA